MKKILFALFIAVFIQGCALVKIQPASTSHLPEEHIDLKNYTIGQIQSVNVGDYVVRHKDYHIVKSTKGVLIADKDFNIPGYNFTTNDEFKILGETEYKHEKYWLINFDNSPMNQFMTRMINQNGTISDRFVYFNIFGPEVHPMSSKIAMSPPDVIFSKTTSTSVNESSGFINFELIYSGKDANSINLHYREYTPDNLIRAAYSQDLKYPADSKTIRFKTIQIQIYEATSEYLRYSVDKDD